MVVICFIALIKMSLNYNCKYRKPIFLFIKKLYNTIGPGAEGRRDWGGQLF